ncbi:MAG TPA: NAD(P)/FAD-dependent oxidoreductase [Atribacterota bacterium]|nr:NAD(P)/FAD-dependent oxidoreductase [Atribacterota bacterium]
MTPIIEKNNFDIAVIGGGPSGMMAAGRAAQLGAKVILLEKNDCLGKKLLITGKGRCNFTHYEFDRIKIAENFGKKGRFLYGALERFGVSEVLDFFQSRGLEWKVERGNRVFPAQGNASTVLKVFIEYLNKGKVKICCDAEISDIMLSDDCSENFKIILNEQKIIVEKIILCTGGKSYPQTGSTGDGYRWAKKFGHTIIEPSPALNPIRTSEAWVKELQGLTLKNVSLQLFQKGKKRDERFGEMLFTHFGISGPIVMDMSKHIGQRLKKGNVKLWLDLKPALDFKKLDDRIQRDFQEFRGRMFKNSLKKLLPASMIEVMVKLSGINGEKKVDHISKEERNRLVHLFKELELTPKQLLGYKWSMVTCGGVKLREINPDTMGSKKMGNLYFAGEILDLDGPSGGYNLQACWSTGYLAGESAAKRKQICQ